MHCTPKGGGNLKKNKRTGGLLGGFWTALSNCKPMFLDLGTETVAVDWDPSLILLEGLAFILTTPQSEMKSQKRRGKNKFKMERLASFSRTRSTDLFGPLPYLRELHCKPYKINGES